MILTEVLYTRFLLGENPLAAVHDARQALHVDSPTAHDWASLTVYASLPPNMDDQVRRAREKSAAGAVWAAIGRLERVADKSARKPLRDALVRAMAYLEAVVPVDGNVAERSIAYGMLARANPRPVGL